MENELLLSLKIQTGPYPREKSFVCSTLMKRLALKQQNQRQIDISKHFKLAQKYLPWTPVVETAISQLDGARALLHASSSFMMIMMTSVLRIF